MATVRSKNPITDNANLMKLLEESETLDTEDAFLGWKANFLEQYMSYLDPDGVENAKNSNKRLAKSLEKLAASVVTVNEFVKNGTITTESQSVQGTRRLTNMTDQMAQTEKEVARFLPTIGAEENAVGYDKFELGAVMIDDGFQVYEHLKTTKDIVQNLQKVVLNDILPANKLSIIQFYIRQIEIFCAVMADLNLFKLMDQIVDMYAVRPRNRNRAASDDLPVDPVIPEPPSKPKKKEKVLDPNTIYTHRAAYTGGYFDPLSGTQPGREEFEDSEPESDDPEGEGEDDNEFMIFFDMKTGRIGKIPRRNCVEMKLIVADKQNKGEEAVQGEVVDSDEKEQLLWEMKKAMKGKQASRSKTPPRSTTPPKSPKVGVRRNNSVKEAKKTVSPPPEAAGDVSPKRGVSRDSGDREASVSPPPETAGDRSPKRVVRRNNSVQGATKKEIPPPKTARGVSPKRVVRRNNSVQGATKMASPPPEAAGDASPKRGASDDSSDESSDGEAMERVSPPPETAGDDSPKRVVRRNNSVQGATKKEIPPPKTARGVSPKRVVRRNNNVQGPTKIPSPPPEAAGDVFPKRGVRDDSSDEEAMEKVSPPPSTAGDRSPKRVVRRNNSVQGATKKEIPPPKTARGVSPKRVVRRIKSDKETLKKVDPSESSSPDSFTRKSPDVSRTSRSPRSPKAETREHCTGAPKTPVKTISKPVKVEPQGNDSTDHKVTLKAPSKAVVAKPSSQGWSSPGVLAAKRRVDKSN